MVSLLVHDRKWTKRCQLAMGFRMPTLCMLDMESLRGRELVGVVVHKYFEGHGYFRGVVNSYFDNEDWYEIVYDDGDREDVFLSEILRLLSNERRDALPKWGHKKKSHRSLTGSRKTQKSGWKEGLGIEKVLIEKPIGDALKSSSGLDDGALMISESSNPVSATVKTGECKPLEIRHVSLASKFIVGMDEEVMFLQGIGTDHKRCGDEELQGHFSHVHAASEEKAGEFASGCSTAGSGKLSMDYLAKGGPPSSMDMHITLPGCAIVFEDPETGTRSRGFKHHNTEEGRSKRAMGAMHSIDMLMLKPVFQLDVDQGISEKGSAVAGMWNKVPNAILDCHALNPKHEDACDNLRPSSRTASGAASLMGENICSTSDSGQKIRHQRRETAIGTESLQGGCSTAVKYPHLHSDPSKAGHSNYKYGASAPSMHADTHALSSPETSSFKMALLPHLATQLHAMLSQGGLLGGAFSSSHNGTSPAKHPQRDTVPSEAGQQGSYQSCRRKSKLRRPKRVVPSATCANDIMNKTGGLGEAISSRDEAGYIKLPSFFRLMPSSNLHDIHLPG